MWVERQVRPFLICRTWLAGTSACRRLHPASSVKRIMCIASMTGCYPDRSADEDGPPKPASSIPSI
jgi:hypothetical protein